MNEKIINVESLQTQINELSALKQECTSYTVDIKSVVGSGLPIDVLAALDAEYGNIKTAIELLLDNSAAFFQGVLDDYVAADEYAAKLQAGGE